MTELADLWNVPFRFVRAVTVAGTRSLSWRGSYDGVAWVNIDVRPWLGADPSAPPTPPPSRRATCGWF